MATVPAARVLTARQRYQLSEVSGTARSLHALALPDPAAPMVWRLEATDRALVLGSTQDDGIVDALAARRAGVNVVRRRSGGGAVLIVPGECVWFDVLLPAGAPGWADDVHRPMIWLGEHVAAALRTVDPSLAPAVHRGSLRTTRWSRAICWDGLGAGEVSIDGNKLVGISQRRTRNVARLQCSWFRRDPTDRLRALLAAEQRPADGELAPVATLPSTDADQVVAQLIVRLDDELSG